MIIILKINMKIIKNIKNLKFTKEKNKNKEM